MSQEDGKRREVIAENEKRAEAVAGLRELADRIESTPWMPVPFHTTLQAGIGYGLDQAGRFAAVRQIADQLGVDVVETSTLARVAELTFPGGITYLVHVNADETLEGSTRRVVPAREDDSAAPELIHALPPISSPWARSGDRGTPRCAGTGPTALFASDVTCPACRALLAVQDRSAEVVTHWHSRGLSITTLCQGEPLTAADFASRASDVTCPGCLALLPEQDGGA